MSSRILAEALELLFQRLLFLNGGLRLLPRFLEPHAGGVLGLFQSCGCARLRAFELLFGVGPRGLKGRLCLVPRRFGADVSGFDPGELCADLRGFLNLPGQFGARAVRRATHLLEVGRHLGVFAVSGLELAAQHLDLALGFVGDLCRRCFRLCPCRHRELFDERCHQRIDVALCRGGEGFAGRIRGGIQRAAQRLQLALRLFRPRGQNAGHQCGRFDGRAILETHSNREKGRTADRLVAIDVPRRLTGSGGAACSVFSDLQRSTECGRGQLDEAR